jgi:cell division septation protein DedD
MNLLKTRGPRMHGVFDEEDLERDRRARDTELTLSSSTLLAIFFGMVLLCGLFFGLGFAVGRYGPGEASAAGQQAAAGAQPANLAASSKAKPSATAPITPVPAPASDPRRAIVSMPVTSSNPQASNSQYAAEPSAPANTYSQSQVKPALPPAAIQPQPVQTQRVEPALPPGVQLMVQIAAVSHPEDADVLVGALRKRGYPVTVRRQPSDTLMHVEIGPFATRNDANSMRQKLLNDGYNAIVQP